MADRLAWALVLGAGRPVRGQEPAALSAAAGQGRALDWQIASLGVSCDAVRFVGGYGFEAVVAGYPSVPAIFNPRWAHTGPVGSLLCLQPWPTTAGLVGYADVLYRGEAVAAVSGAVARAGAAADVALLVDSRWRGRYEGRGAADLARAEVLTVDCEGWLSEPHASATTQQAEFAGLACLGARALALLAAWAPRPEVAGWGLPQLFEAWREAGLHIACIDCRGDWAEFNAPQDVARFVLGTKAQSLARLEPLVRASRIGASVSFTVGQWLAEGAACVRAVQQAFAPHRVVVRSSAIGEDGFADSSAGRYTSVLGVEASRAEQLAEAVAEVVASYGEPNPVHQVLVQRMHERIGYSGVVMTRTLSHGAPYRVINFDADPLRADAVTSGRGGRLGTLYIHRDCALWPLSAPDALAPLQPAVAEIEALVGHDSLDIEFIVDDEGLVHILQVRPIAVDHGHWRGSDAWVREALAQAREALLALAPPAPGQVGRQAMYSVMTDWNPAEMIGTRPRRLAFSLYAELITQEVWALQRQQFGYRRLQPQPLMRSLAGHAYIDVRASLNSFVPAALDEALAERLVEHGLMRLRQQPHLHDRVEFEVAFTCMAFDFERRAQALRDQGWRDDEVARLRQALTAITAQAFDRLDEELARLPQLLQRQQAVQAASLSPLRAAITWLDDCRALGTLPFAHLARMAFVAMNLLNSAVSEGVISVAEREAYLRSVATVALEVRDDCARLQAGQLPLAQFLGRHGHLRPGTYDITVPSYAEAPARYLGQMAQAEPVAPAEPDAAAHVSTEAAPWSPATRARFCDALAAVGLPHDFERVDRFLRGAIAGRERAKFDFTRSLSLALDAIARFGQQHGLSRDDLSHLSLADLRSIDLGQIGPEGTARLHARAEEGRLAHALAQGIELPPLLTGPDDLQAFLQPDDQPNFVGAGRVDAPVIVVDMAQLDPSRLPGHIVLALQADPGYDWLFGHRIAGLITAYGGANSHMAVRAAEFGLPAAIGVGEQRYREWAACQRLRLDCEARTVEVLA